MGPVSWISRKKRPQRLRHRNDSETTHISLSNGCCRLPPFAGGLCPEVVQRAAGALMTLEREHIAESAERIRVT